MTAGTKRRWAMFLGAPGGRALPRWIVAHLNELTESDFELLKKSEKKFHVVHSPRSHDYFKHSRFPFEKLRALGSTFAWARIAWPATKT